MIEVLLVIAMIGLLPLAYLRGKRAGFERHQCRHIAPPGPGAETYVIVPARRAMNPSSAHCSLPRSFAAGCRRSVRPLTPPTWSTTP